MKTIHYPIKGRKLSDIVNQDMLNKLITQMDNWQQGPGVFGALNIHACWGTASVLDKRYQGETISHFVHYMRTFRKLYEKTKNPKWRALIDNMASHILYLQDANGGFIHSTAEFEPSFDTRGCMIHYFNPIIALLEYYNWEYGDEYIKTLIKPAVERHWKWSGYLWQIGNGRWRPLTFPGWCGVTNQDLTVIAALAMIGKTFGDWGPYEKFGKPSLDHYLSPAYYYKDIGLFERGDGVNFAERSPYYNVIIDCLHTIYEYTGDSRTIEAADNVCDHLFGAIFKGEDGFTYIARGAITDAHDKSKVLGWEKEAISFNSYPAFITNLREYLTRYPNAERSALIDELEVTLAGYIFEDGNIPQAIFGKNPLFTIASIPSCEGILNFTVNYLGDKLRDPEIVELPTIHRVHKSFTWKQKGRLWAVEEDGVRKYGGFTRYVGGITIGPDEKPVFGDYATLEECDIIEIID